MRLYRFKYLFLVLAIGLVGFKWQTRQGYVNEGAKTEIAEQGQEAVTDSKQQDSSASDSNLSTSSEEKAFQDALNDTKVAIASEISKNLTAVVSYNSNLQWNGGRALMALCGDDYYKRYKAGDYFTISPAHLVWVFPPYEMKNFLKKNSISKKNLNDRLKKLLGLRPETENTLFVELWVNPIDMYRPSPDPEISDQEAELDFPSNPYFTISQTYKNWFNDRKATIYTGSRAMPWTGLGYTYDWGSSKHVGMSEYVIIGNALVQVYSITPMESYK